MIFGGLRMQKVYKTIPELVSILESRGVATDEDTPAILRREGYYPVVNGYGAPFLDHVAMESAPDDMYLPGTTFGNIYDLFVFDRRLRQTLFPVIASAETLMRNAVVGAFCDRHRTVDAYLERSNYADAHEMLVPAGFRGNKAAMHSRNLADLMRRLNSKVTDRSSMKPYVRHYVDSYGAVPLWVLCKDLTFGNMSHFYQLQTRGVQNAACRAVAEINGNGRRIGARALLDAFETLVGYRNICAHDERLYCADVKGASYADMVRCLWLVLPMGEVQSLVVDNNRLMDEFGERIGPETRRKVFEGMGVQFREPAR